MFLKKLTLHNFKGFQGDNEISFSVPDNQTAGSGLNVFVGENNTGKSTIFEAIHFLRNGTTRDIEEIIFKSNQTIDKTNDVRVEAEFVGNISDIAQCYAEKKSKAFSDRLSENAEDGELLRVRRGGNCPQNLKQIQLFNPSKNDFDNPSGIDAPFRALFDINCIWADTNPQDEAKFGSTTLCGNLLKAIASNYSSSNEFKNFSNTFDGVFNNSSSLLRQQIEQIENQLNSIFSEQFGNSKVLFSFDPPTTDILFKNVKIRLENGDRVTDLADEGMGLQRAVSLSLLQVYANIVSAKPDMAKEKPFIFIIDEPEICLHPIGQRKLLNSLLEISKNQQVFISTHSPFFLEGDVLRNANLILCTKEGRCNKMRCYEKAENLFPWSPSWGEICFEAYNLPTVEFHNELYGHLQYLSNCYTEKTFENWLSSQGIHPSKSWTREDKGNPQKTGNQTLATFIRNKIHHPENKTMSSIKFSDEELFKSIKIMINLIRTVKQTAA